MFRYSFAHDGLDGENSGLSGWLADTRWPSVSLHRMGGTYRAAGRHAPRAERAVPYLGSIARVVAKTIMSSPWTCADTVTRTGQGGYRVRSMARDVHGLIDALGLGPVDLVGHSACVRVAIAVPARSRIRYVASRYRTPGRLTPNPGRSRCATSSRRRPTCAASEASREARDFYLSFHPEWKPEFIDLHVQFQLRRDSGPGKLVPKADPDLQWITGSSKPARCRVPVGDVPSAHHADPAYGGQDQQRPGRGDRREDAGGDAGLDPSAGLTPATTYRVNDLRSSPRYC